MPTLAELENEIFTRTGVKPGNSDWKAPYIEKGWNSTTNRFTDISIAGLLREWLLQKGCPSAYEQSHLVLRNAYHGGNRYISKIEKSSSRKKDRSVNLDAGGLSLGPILSDEVKKRLTERPAVGAGGWSSTDDPAASSTYYPKFEPPKPQPKTPFNPFEEEIPAEEFHEKAINELLDKESEAKTSTDETDQKLCAAAEALRGAAILLEANGINADALFDKPTIASAKARLSTTQSNIPDTDLVAARDIFGDFMDGLSVPRFREPTEFTPQIDPNYSFDEETTFAIILGFSKNKRVLISGKHGTGKSTHVEQIAARLNWPFFRLNLDGHISRTDMIGRDSIVLKDGQQVTEFKEGILPWAMQQPLALCLDEYDAGRPDVLFVIQRLLETSGKLTLAEQNRVIDPHIGFRIFGTANTIGLGDATGLYHGTNPLNAAQMDRWNIVVKLDYLPAEKEHEIVRGHCPYLKTETIKMMVLTAKNTRDLFAANKISTVMSPRTVISWGENIRLYKNVERAFKFTFLNKCDDAEIDNISQCFKTAFAGALT